MTKQTLSAKVAELEKEAARLRAENKKLNNNLIQVQQTITDIEREKIKNDKPWYWKLFGIVIVLLAFTSCEKQPMNKYDIKTISSSRNVTILPFSRIRRNDTTIILDGDSTMRRYCCTIYRESGVPYGNCYSSSGECVSCEEVCAVAVPRN